MDTYIYSVDGKVSTYLGSAEVEDYQFGKMRRNLPNVAGGLVPGDGHVCLFPDLTAELRRYVNKIFQNLIVGNFLKQA